MQPPVTVAALAVADGPADAIGVVQLACEDDALALTLLRAGAYREGFVPGTLASAVTLRVPYAAVRGLVQRGRALVLTLDRSVPSPFHRFALARFTDDPAETLASLHRAHRLAGALSWVLPGPLGALAAALPSAELVGGALGRTSLALLVALFFGAAMRGIAAWLAWGGPVSDRHRQAFEAAIAERLGLLPARLHDRPARLHDPRVASRDPAASLRERAARAHAPPALPQGGSADPQRLQDLHDALHDLRRGLNDQHRGLDALHRALDDLHPAPASQPLALQAQTAPLQAQTAPLQDQAPSLHEGSAELQEDLAPLQAIEPPRARRLSPGAPPHIDLTARGAPKVPWARVVGLAAVVALGAVSAIAFVRRFGTTSAPAAPEIDDTVTAARGEIPPKPPPPPPPPREERCFCARADSPLWRDGIPVLTVLTTTGPDGTLAPPAPKLDEHDKSVFGYDVAVVNNGAKSIRETRIVLTYARRDSQDHRVAVTDRGLYWGKPLGPGRAIKWTTEGPGTEVRIDKSELGTLEERGLDPAPADAFFALTGARHRVVRLHAAMMLAYLHDPRAGEALSSIGAPMAVEGWTVRRIRAAASPFLACDVTTAEGRLSACVFNTSTKPGSGLSLREIQDDESRPARAWPVRVEVPVHDGVKLAWPLEGDPPGDLAVAAEP